MMLWMIIVMMVDKNDIMIDIVDVNQNINDQKEKDI